MSEPVSSASELDSRPPRALTRHECQVLIDAHLDAVPASEAGVAQIRLAAAEAVLCEQAATPDAVRELSAVREHPDAVPWLHVTLALAGAVARCSDPQTASAAFRHRDSEPAWRSDLTSAEVADILAGYLTGDLPQLGVDAWRRQINDLISYFTATPASMFQSAAPAYAVCMQLVAMAGQTNVLTALRWCRELEAELVASLPHADLIARKMAYGGAPGND